MKQRVLSFITVLIFCLSLLPGTALAADTPTRTETLDLREGKFTPNDGASQGWNWEVTGEKSGTLTLTNCHIKAATPNLIILPAYYTVTIILEGNNTLETTASDWSGMVIYQDAEGHSIENDTHSIIQGSGSLELIGSGSMFGFSGERLTIESGTVTTQNAGLCTILGDFTLKDGTITIRQPQADGYGIYVATKDINILGGELDIQADIGIWITGVPNKPSGCVNISGGTVKIESTTYGILVNYSDKTNTDSTKQAFYMTGGSLDIKSGNLGLYAQTVDINGRDVMITAESESNIALYGLGSVSIANVKKLSALSKALYAVGNADAVTLPDSCVIRVNEEADAEGAAEWEGGIPTFKQWKYFEINAREVQPPAHIHDWQTAWASDETHHWHECAASDCTAVQNSQKAGYGLHTFGSDGTCTACGYSAGNGNQIKLEIQEGIPEVPEGLKDIPKLDTPEKIIQQLKTIITSSGTPSANTAVYDVQLLISTDGGITWIPATADNFPPNGLTVTLPYPDRANRDCRFTVVHMFTGFDFGKQPGDTEIFTPDAVTNTADGLQVTVTGLSPFAVGWTAGTDNPETPPTDNNHGGKSGTAKRAIIVENTNHGKVISSLSKAASGKSVTLTVVPNNGYVLETITVTDSQGDEIKLTAQENGKYTFTMPGYSVTVRASFVPQPDDEKNCDGSADCPSRSFTDLGNSAIWYHEAVDFVLENGWMAGCGNGLFEPNHPLSRAQLVQILYNCEGRPTVMGSNVFTDVDSNIWYSTAVIWASECGIADGYGNGLFGPEDSITREQLAVILWRYAGNCMVTEKNTHFNDADKISGYAYDALFWAVENGIIRGKDNSILDPAGFATRAQAAQMLKNFTENR